MIHTNRIKTLIVFLFIAFQVFGQEFPNILKAKQALFHHINPEDGLNENSIQTILQDSIGFMWFGTPNGLYRYDGYSFKVFRNDFNNPFSLSENSITVLHEDSDNNLWIGTEKELNVYNKLSEKFHEVTETKKNEKVRDLKIHSIVEDIYGTVWVGSQKGLYKVLKSNSLLYSLEKIDATIGSVNVLQKLVDGSILIGTTKGLKKLILKDEKYEILDIRDSKTKSRNNNSSIISIHKDRNGKIWIANPHGLFTIDLNLPTGTDAFIFKKVELLNTYLFIESITSDFEENLWLGTRNNGVISYNPETGKINQFVNNKRSPNSLTSNSILDLYIDNSGVLWIATSRGGLNKLDLLKKNFIHFRNNPDDPNSLAGNIINDFFETKNGEVFIATFDNGLNKLYFENDKVKFKNIHLNNALSKEKIWSFCKDNYNNIWVSTANDGLYRLKLDAKNNIIKKSHYTVANTNNNLPSNNISTLYTDRNGDIWMGAFIGGVGLLKFTPNNEDKLPTIHTFNSSLNEPNKITDNRVVSIFEDSKNNLWVGTRNGLNKIIRDKQNNPIKITQLTSIKNNPKSLSNNNVFSIIEDSHGTIWIATFGGGICKMIQEINEDKENIYFETLNENNGLINNAVYGILEDGENNLWISTNNGISQFNTETKSFKNFNISDGLQGRNFRKFAYHKGASGLLYFGGIKGFNTFLPKDITLNKLLPKTAITDLKISNKSVGIDEKILNEIILKKSILFTNKIDLKYKSNSFTFEFSSLHYSSPENNKFAHKLEGFDEDWIITDASRRFATYSNLNHGLYTFKVKSSNKDGIWNDISSNIQLDISPPIWKTWWMYLVYLLIFLTILVTYRRYIVEKERFKAELNIQKFEKQKIKEVNKLKLEFFTNVSHEFKTPLTLILGPLEKLIGSKKTVGPIKDVLLLMQRNANQLYKLIQQILEFRKIENNEIELSLKEMNIVQFCKEMTESFESLAKTRKLKIEFKSKETEIIGNFDRDKLEKIINNLMSNALKFTPKKGEISFNISVKKVSGQNSSDTIQNFVQLVIKDNGQGIPDDKLPYIFKRFYQVDSSKGDQMESGVGLALTKALVDLHQGEIFAKSIENEGAKFIVRIPLGLKVMDKNWPEDDYSSNNELFIESDLDEIEAEEKGEIKNKPLILVVEDNSDMRTFICDLLNTKFRVLEASDGEEGEKLAIENIPDLIISDVMMPKMNGKQLCKKLKSNEITSHIPIILLTAKSSIESKILGIKLGADAYIPKPFNIEFLLARIINLLELRASLRQKYLLIENESNSIDGNTTDQENVKSKINIFDQKFIDKVEAVIEKNLMNEEFGVNDLGDELGYSRMQLYRKLKFVTNFSANEFIRSYRLKKSASLLLESDMNITEILYEVGFSNRSYYAKCFKLKYGKSPREYKEQH